MYSDISAVKKILTEKGPVEDSKVQQYSLMADNYINKKLINLSSVPVIPIPSSQVTKVLSDICTALAVAYFYEFESGDTITARTAEKSADDWFTNSFRRPRFFVSTGRGTGPPSNINYAAQH